MERSLPAAAHVYSDLFRRRHLPVHGARGGEFGREVEKVTAAMCEKILKRVQQNMLKVVAKKGGNFYKE